MALFRHRLTAKTNLLKMRRAFEISPYFFTQLNRPKLCFFKGPDWISSGVQTTESSKFSPSKFVLSPEELMMPDRCNRLLILSLKGEDFVLTKIEGIVNLEHSGFKYRA
jgi:hypothetical protein